MSTGQDFVNSEQKYGEKNGIQARAYWLSFRFLISEKIRILTFRKSVDALDLYSWHFILNDSINLKHVYNICLFVTLLEE